jgi:polyhydroxybutyrate depolymerase
MRLLPALLVASVATLAACGNGDTSRSTDTTAVSAIESTAPVTSELPVTSEAPVSTVSETTNAPAPTADPSRPYELYVPTTYDGTTPMPLVMLLHGYGASAVIQEAYFQLQGLAESRGFIYVRPDGTTNALDKQFWNATPACCGFNSGVDDSTYLLDVITDISNAYNVDPRRVYVMGHSNGGFMSYRMACDHADRIAAIASLAGSTFATPADCAPSQPVSVLQVHGTDDQTIFYNGSEILGQAYPGATTTVDIWAGYDKCGAPSSTASPPLDIEQGIAGAETNVSTYTGCPTGIDVELWSVQGGGHIPAINSATTPYPMSSGIIDFLLAHPKP